MIDEALKYRIEFGLSVFPIAENSKRPIFGWKRFQMQLPSFKEIVGWNDRMNLAMATGQLSGIVVIDCESEEDARWFAATKSNSPIKVQTPRGFHLWFRHPGYDVPNAAKVKDDNGRSRYDIRGDGGYVLIPNSRVLANEKDIHVSGEYQWRGNLSDLNSLPLFNQSWRQSSQPNSQDEHAIRNGTEYIKRIFAVAGQGGHGATWQAVNCLRESGMSQTEATFALLRWNETNANPPWSEKELQHKIEDAYGRTR